MDRFLCEVICRSGESIHIGGLCKKNTSTQQTEKCRRLRALNFSDQDDLYDVDYKLADKIGRVFSKDVYVIGASVNTAHIMNGSAGGVIGSPVQKLESAWAEIEYIGHGLYMIAKAEGPGIAAKCTEQEMNDVMQILMRQYTNIKECIDKVINYFTVHYIDNYLITADGSGEKGEETVICKAGEAHGLSKNV